MNHTNIVTYTVQDCLAPNVQMTLNRPNPDIFNITNTSVTLGLMAPPLDEHCNDIVISFPPVIFGVIVEDGARHISGFLIVSVTFYFLIVD